MNENTLKPRQSRSEKTREKILAASEKLLNDDPYAELSMPGIAKAAGVSVGGLYGRFVSREMLLDAVHERYAAHRDVLLEERLYAHRDSDLNLPTRIRMFAEAFVYLHSSQAGVLRSFIIGKWLSPGSAPSESARSQVRDHKAAIVGFLMAAPSGGGPDPDQDHLTRVVEYIISVSKDQLVITPDTADEASAKDTAQLVSDLCDMAAGLLNAPEVTALKE